MEKCNLSFNDFIDKCNMRCNGLISGRAFEQFILDKVKIRTYIPLEEKNNIIRRLIMTLDGTTITNTDAADFATNQAIYHTFNVLLAYTDLEHTYQDVTIDHYDTIMKSGIFDIIMDECKNDYNRFVSMINEAMSYQSLFNTQLLMESIDSDKLDEKTKVITDILTNKEVMENMNNILAFNDPNMKALQKELREFDLDKLKGALASMKKGK